MFSLIPDSFPPPDTRVLRPFTGQGGCCPLITCVSCQHKKWLQYLYVVNVVNWKNHFLSERMKSNTKLSYKARVF